MTEILREQLDVRESNLRFQLLYLIPAWPAEIYIQIDDVICKSDSLYSWSSSESASVYIEKYVADISQVVTVDVADQKKLVAIKEKGGMLAITFFVFSALGFKVCHSWHLKWDFSLIKHLFGLTGEV